MNRLATSPIESLGAGTTGTTEVRASSSGTAVVIPQYSRRKVFAVWAAAAGPMGILAWIVAPPLGGAIGGPEAFQRALLISITAGLVWQFVLTLVLVYHEQRTLRWSVVRQALWLRAPRSPKTGKRGGWLWLVLLPLVVGFGVAHKLVPALPHPLVRDPGVLLASHAGHVLLHGNWALLVLMTILVVFNTVLGEELLFRGLLLPRMNGSFGRFDWLANGILFTAYHIHEWWAMPQVIFDTLTLAYPSKRYRSSLIGIIVHSVQDVVVIFAVLSLVLK
jgi:membrane protease YdiL (CAAX protease family)